MRGSTADSMQCFFQKDVSTYWAVVCIAEQSWSSWTLRRTNPNPVFKDCTCAFAPSSASATNGHPIHVTRSQLVWNILSAQCTQCRREVLSTTSFAFLICACFTTPYYLPVETQPMSFRRDHLRDRDLGAMGERRSGLMKQICELLVLRQQLKL